MRTLAMLVAIGTLSAGTLAAGAAVSPAGAADPVNDAAGVSVPAAVPASGAPALPAAVPASGAPAPPAVVATVLAESALKCGRPWGEGLFAIVLDGVLVLGPMPLDEVDADAFEWPPTDRLAASYMICRPEFEGLGVAADDGFYVLTRDTGAHLLDEALREIHALQEAHWGEHGHWAGSVEALGYTLPDPGLSIEIEVREDGEMWTGRGTHAMDIRRCSVYGWGALRSPAAVERNATPQCVRLTLEDEAFPRSTVASEVVGGRQGG